MKRILSSALAIIMLFGCLTTCFAVPVAAAPISDAGMAVENYLQVLEDAFDHKYASTELYLQDQLEKGYMHLMARYNGYELYCNPVTGEVAYVNIATGQTMTSNPVNFESLGTSGAEKTLPQLLSQLEISFVDNEGNPTQFYSYTEAAKRNQIIVKYMKNGFRVEYTMGRLNTNYMVPGVVEADFYNEYLLGAFDRELEKIAADPQLGEYSSAYKAVKNARSEFNNWFTEFTYVKPKDENGKVKNDKEAEKQLNPQLYVYAEKNPDTYQDGAKFFVLDETAESGITEPEMVYLENIIKSYCPDVDQDILDVMHAKTGYVRKTKERPVFRAAIEYVLEDDGLSVRLPANSIRFDETKYTLQYVKMLQYFGAGNLNNSGYVFYPDGSGALVEFEKFYSADSSEKRVSVELSGSVYGADFAYYNINANAKHSETIRVPVFGIVDSKKDASTGVSYSKGFLAILEEGDALADIATSFGASTHNYASAYTKFYPRPSDSYNMSEAISVADNKEMTIVSDKKYTGSYVQKYKMLFDETEKSTLVVANSDYYNASYVGMATAYRDYLLAKNVIEERESDEVEDQLPLYIETLGSVETVKKVLSIPVTTDVALADFDDVETMYDQLAKKGIKNIHFKLTGYANGGIHAKYPKKLKWMKSVGGKKGFNELLDAAETKGFGVYPEFEFSYVAVENGGLRLKNNAARAVDDRYCSKQVYNPVYQEFESYFNICISPNMILEYVQRFDERYLKFNPTGISVSSLGGELNSNFDKKNSLNREDAKDYVISALEHLDTTYDSVMASGGNIYSVQYLDHLLDFSIDSSNYKYESKTVPFLGMVLHGYVNYAGSVINEAGDGEYQLLKAIENGSLLYYMLIYRNSNLLKEDEELSKFYSVRFDIWFNTIVEQYDMLNSAIGDLQLYNIVDHKFLTVERVPLELEENRIIKALMEEMNADLEEQYASLVELKNIELFIKQTAKTAILAGVTEEEALLAQVKANIGRNLNAAEKSYVSETLAAYKGGAELPDYYGDTVFVTIDRDALLASIKSITGKDATAEQIKVVDDFILYHPTTDGDHEVVINSFSDDVEFTKKTTSSFALDLVYDSTEYTDNSGSVVMVTYSNGTKDVQFVLNYNLYDVKVRLKGVNGDETFVVPGYGFQRIEGARLVTK